MGNEEIITREDFLEHVLYEDLNDTEKMNLYKLQTKLERKQKLLKADEHKFKNNKYVIGLKYQNVKTKINVIQLSVMVLSTAITFIESLKEHFSLSEVTSTIIPIVLSTYIALVLAISRFYRFEEQKENLSKLFEKHAFVINRIKHKSRLIKCNLPVQPKDNKQLNDILMTFDKDGLDEVITQSMQEMDSLLPLKEKLHFENMLVKLHIDRKVLKRNLENLERHEEDMNEYKSKVSTLWYYLCCLYTGPNYVIDEEKAFDDMESNRSKNAS